MVQVDEQVRVFVNNVFKVVLKRMSRVIVTVFMRILPHPRNTTFNRTPYNQTPCFNIKKINYVYLV